MLASVNPLPADIVKSRGAWDVVAALAPPAATPTAVAPPTAAAAPSTPAGPSTAAGDVKAPPPGAGAAGSGGQRFVWLTGPQGRPVERAASATPPAEPPRPPAEIPPHSLRETTRACRRPDRKDRFRPRPLAYAAQPSRDLRSVASGAGADRPLRLAPPATAVAPAARTLSTRLRLPRRILPGVTIIRGCAAW